MSRFTENDIVLKNYRIEKSIGQGAFGEVYLATHLGLNGKRAIKVLLRDELGMGSSDYDEYRNRFRQESQLMEWFKHPNVVTVYDFQEEDGVLFLVMEYATGGNLQKKLEIARRENERFTVDEVVRVGIDIAEGLSALHAKDVVHRDLKPSNILFDAQGRAKVADLGLAQIPGGASMRSQLSIPKPHPGTPAYMSPEQELAGSYLRPSSDVYALGLVLFELLTGRSYKNLRPGTRLNALVPSSPDWLDDQLARMLAKEADNRPWDGAETVQELRKGLKLGDLQMREAREIARQEEEERAQIESMEKAHREEEERDRLAEQEKARLETEERARREEAEKIRHEEEERIRLANMEKTRLELEERARKLAEAKSIREREIKDLEEQVRIAIIADDKTQAEKALVALRKLGDEGRAIARNLSSEYGTKNNTSKKYWLIGSLCLFLLVLIGIFWINAKPSDSLGTSMIVGTLQNSPTPVTSVPTEFHESKVSSSLELAFSGKFKGSTVTIAGPFSDNDAVKFDESLKSFEDKTGIDIQYFGSKDFEASIGSAIEGNNPPDIVDFPQPGLLSYFAQKGKVIDLANFMDMKKLQANYIQSWIDMGTMEGPKGPILAGIWGRVNGKSIVWYPKKAFDEAGYNVPKTWDELMKLTDKIKADGDTPWCVGIESGAATGWVMTDWIEELLLRTTSLENYDKWVKGELKFSSPEVKNAVQKVSDLWFTEGNVYGGRKSIATTAFGDTPKPMFENPPKCWLHKQGNFITAFFPNEAKAGVDFDFFYLPGIDEKYGKPVLVAGDIYAMFNDRPEVRAVMEYFSTGASVEGWVKAGGAISPHKDSKLEWYTNDVDRGIAKMIQDATSVRFDGSDQMPGAVGAGSFWREMTSYVSGSINMDTAVKKIDESWP